MKTLLVTSTPNHPLLEKILFEVLDFQNEDIVWATPDKPYQGATPDVIIPIGKEALPVVGLDNQSIIKIAGQVMYVNDMPPVVPALSPGYVERNPQLLEEFAQHFYTAYKVACGITDLEKSNKYVMVTEATQLMDLILYIKESGYVCFDFETTELTDLKTYDPDFYLTMLSLSFQQGSSYVIPLYHKDSPNSKEFIETCRLKLAQEVFGNPDVTKIGHNIKFDMHCLAWWGIDNLVGPYHDTMVMHHILDEHSKHNLKLMVEIYNPRYAGYEKEIREYRWDQVPLPLLAKYGALDSDLDFRLYWQFTEMLMQDERLYILFRNLEAPLTLALFYMEYRGMQIDKSYLVNSIEKVEGMIRDTEEEMQAIPQVRKYRQWRLDEAMVTLIEGLESKIEQRKAKIFKTAKAQKNNEAEIQKMEELVARYDEGELNPGDYIDKKEYEVNFSSAAQMKELLYSKQGFDFQPPKDQWGNPLESTGKDVIPLLKDKSGFVDGLLALRQLNKVLNTYLYGILNRLDSNHTLHGTFNQHGTKTGRLSSSDPNLQNIITRTKYDRVEEAVKFVKKSFIPLKNSSFLQADYSQAELRLIAFYAQEDTMLKAYAAGEDLHALTASATMGMSLKEFKALVEKEYKRYRYEAKSTNFGFIYGMSAEGFKDYARNNYGIEVSLKQAQQRREKFFKKYPKLLEYHEIYKAKARKFGYVRTLFGRRVRIPDIYSNDTRLQSHAERNAINSPIQGTAGEMMKFAIALLFYRAPWLRMVNTVHDSLDVYATSHMEHPTREITIIKETMENLPIQEYFERSVDTVDMKADFEISPSSWGELQEI